MFMQRKEEHSVLGTLRPSMILAQSRGSIVGHRTVAASFIVQESTH